MKISFDHSKKQKPDYDSGMKVPYAPAKRAASTWKWYAVVLITASPLIFFLIKIIFSYIFISAPGMVSFRSMDLSSPETASVQKIFVKKGDSIKTGSLLAAFSYPDMDFKLAGLYADREDLKNNINKASANPYNVENLKLLEKIRDEQNAYLAKVRYLYQKGAATYAELNLALTQSNQAQLEWARAKADYDLSKKRPVNTEIQTKLNRIDHEIESIEKKRGGIEYKSPGNGYISQVYITENQTVSKGAQLFRLTSKDGFIIKAYINPSQINHAGKGKKVTMKFPGYHLVTGIISSAPESARTIPSELSESFYEAKQAVEVNIIPKDPVPHELWIDGLPIKVYFGFPDFLYRG